MPIEDSARFAHLPVDQLRVDVARALAALPEKYRQIILLRDLEELTISELARRLTISGEVSTREPLAAMPALLVALIVFRGRETP